MSTVSEQVSKDDTMAREDRALENTALHTTEQGSIVPKLGLGTYDMDSLECFEATRRALEMGYRHIDTAMAYDNEAAVGRAVATADVPRDEVFLTTKVKGYPRYLTHEGVLEQTTGCLERLGVDTIDLLLIHWWHPQGDMEGTMAALDRLYEEGRVDHVGVSNFSVDQLRRARRLTDAPILTNQIEYHAYRDQTPMLAYCREHDIILTAYSPLAQGALLGDETLTTIGNRYGKTPAQVALRWLVQQDQVITIPKAASEAHQSQNLAIFDFELTAEEMRTIADLEGPLQYRLTADDGPIDRARHWVGQYVPKSIRANIP